MSLQRRSFIKLGLSATGALILFVSMPPLLANTHRKQKFKSLYLEITPENEFIMTFDKSEMGQGVMTGQATLFGEEADIAPDQFIMQPAPADERYGVYMGIQSTGGSTSTKQRWLPLRQIGAGLRIGLIAAASKYWNIKTEKIQTERGEVINTTTGEKLPFATFNEQLSTYEFPEEPPLKPKSQFKYIGKWKANIDQEDKVTAKAIYGVDFKIDGLKNAVLLRCPTFGGKVKSFDASKAKQMTGVIDVIEISNGVAVVCDKYWQCIKARELVQVEWEIDKELKISSEDIYENFKKEIEVDPLEPSEDEQLITAEYVAPYLAHATAEPQNTTAWFHDGKLDVWSPTQSPSGIKRNGARIADVDRDDVHVEVMKYMGCGFGRRGASDFATEAMEVAVKVKFPVRLQWSREDDMRFSPLRSLTVHRFDALISSTKDEKKILEWNHQIAGQPVFAPLISGFLPTALPEWMDGWLSPLLGSATGGIMDLFNIAPNLSLGATLPYDIDHDVDDIPCETNIPVNAWRSMGHAYNAFAVESFFDEVAHTLGKDPYDYRLDLLKESPRTQNVIKTVAEAANWHGYKKENNRALGLAFHHTMDTRVAQIAEVEVTNGKIKIIKVWCAIDCGLVVNPQNVIGQMRSGIIFGLSAALYGDITIKDGGIQQSNFHDYPMLSLSETPDIEVSIIDSDEDPTGVGEPGMPPIAAAVGNAIFNVTGKRLRTLPFKLV